MNWNNFCCLPMEIMNTKKMERERKKWKSGFTCHNLFLEFKFYPLTFYMETQQSTMSTRHLAQFIFHPSTTYQLLLCPLKTFKSNLYFEIPRSTSKLHVGSSTWTTISILFIVENILSGAWNRSEEFLCSFVRQFFDVITFSLSNDIALILLLHHPCVQWKMSSYFVASLNEKLNFRKNWRNRRHQFHHWAVFMIFDANVNFLWIISLRASARATLMLILIFLLSILFFSFFCSTFLNILYVFSFQNRWIRIVYWGVLLLSLLHLIICIPLLLLLTIFHEMDDKKMRKLLMNHAGLWWYLYVPQSLCGWKKRKLINERGHMKLYLMNKIAIKMFRPEGEKTCSTEMVENLCLGSIWM